MTSCPTDLSPPEPRVSPATEPAGLAGETELNMAIQVARDIVAGKPLVNIVMRDSGPARMPLRVPVETLVMSLAQTVCKLADQAQR